MITKDSIVSKLYDSSIIKIPIAHGEGKYYCDSNTLIKLEKNNQIIFKYCDENGMSQTTQILMDQ